MKGTSFTYSDHKVLACQVYQNIHVGRQEYLSIDKCIYSRLPVSNKINLSHSHVHVDTESRYATAIETFINMMLNSYIVRVCRSYYVI